MHGEFLDQASFWNSLDLQRKLLAFSDYFNLERVHSALAGDTPNEVESCGSQTARLADLGCYRWRSHCRNLYMTPGRR